MEKRYSALRFIGTIYKLIGILVLVLTVLGALAACVGALLGGTALSQAGSQSGVPFLPFLSSAIGGLFLAFFGLLYGGAIGLTLFAAGDLISLLLALEENTRNTAALLRGQPAPPAPH